MVALVFGVQLALIFGLGRTSSGRPQSSPVPALTLRLAGSGAAKLLALNDPTLFVLPDRERTVGPAPSRTPDSASSAFPWPEPTNSLTLAVDQLGATFSRLVGTNGPDALQVLARPEPSLTFPNLLPAAISSQPSTLRLEGALAQRRLMTPPALRPWPSTSILSNSVVQIVVDADGRPVSPPTLLSGSGSSQADQDALDAARAARFEPVRRNPADTARNPAADLSWGRMVFRWQTLPQPPATTPPASP